MDQINTLYEELVKFDPSLGSNKEVVLQVIQKMIAAKPTIATNPAWKERFAEKLSEHILSKKAVLPRRGSFFLRATKRSISLSTFFVAVVVVGAAYRGVQIVKKNGGRITVPHVATRMAQEDSGAQETKVNDTGADSVMMSNVAEDSSVALQVADDKNHPLENAQQVLATQAHENPRAAEAVSLAHDAIEQKADAKNLTELDTHDTGSIPLGIMAKKEDVTPPPPQSAERKTVALLFVDAQGAALESPALSFLQVQGVAATFVENNATVKAELANLGYEIVSSTLLDGSKAKSFIDLSTSNENNVAASVHNHAVIRIDLHDLLLHPEILEKLVADLQAEGYVFITLSAMQQ